MGILFAPPQAHAQIAAANVIGTVQDATHSNIQGAEVRLVNTATGAENAVETNPTGRFVITGVAPGSYILRIERPGFAITQINNLSLNVGDTRTVIIRMKIGPISESVTVDADELATNSADASVSTIVGRSLIQNIPLNGRSLQDLISMTPGIVTPNPQEIIQESSVQSGFGVNGQSLQANSFIVDGLSANINIGPADGKGSLSLSGSSGGTTALGTTQSLVPVDALREFRVLSSTYSAEYGRTPGGQFTFATRSGTNTLHGSAYEYFRNNHFDAKNWFEDPYAPSSSQFA